MFSSVGPVDFIIDVCSTARQWTSRIIKQWAFLDGPRCRERRSGDFIVDNGRYLEHTRNLKAFSS
jgi:hypothetical protein